MASGDATTGQRRDRADVVAERIAIPVLVAALASVPAVFLTLLDEPWSQVGGVLNGISGFVLLAETVVLFVVSSDRIAWMKRNWLLLALAVAIIPAVIFAIGPVQLLRLLRVVGALRILRVKRIFKAGALLRERYGFDKRWQRVVTFLMTLLAAAFVTVVLADPTSNSRRMVDSAWSWLGTTGVVVAGLILAAATFIVLRAKQGEQREDSSPRSDA